MTKQKYTKDLVVGFKNLCDKIQTQSGTQRIAIGIAVVVETGVKLKDYKGARKSPLLGELANAFSEMVDNEWIKEIQVDDQDRNDLYFEYKDHILKAGLPYYSQIDEMKKILAKPWPVGDHMFRLTAKGEDVAVKLEASRINKLWYAIKDNARPIVQSVIGVLIATFILFVVKKVFDFILKG